MAAKRKACPEEHSSDEDEITRIHEDGTREVYTERDQPPQRRRRVSKKQPTSAAIPASYRIDNVALPAGQPNRPRMRQPILLDPTRHANFLCPPTIVQRPNRPINMAANQRQCWCNQVSGDVQAIREMMSAVNNGVHCAIQKLHTDQIKNQETISNIMNTVEMIADTVTQLLLSQLQACEQYVNDDNAAGSDGDLNDGTYNERGDEALNPNYSYSEFH